MATPSPLYTQIKETALYFIHSYNEDLIRADIQNFARALAPDCLRYYAPAALVEMMPQLSKGETNQGYIEKERYLFEQLYESWTVEAKDVTVDEVQRKAVVHSLHTSNGKNGNTYPFEFCFTLWMDEKAEKVVKIVEFVDVSMANKFLDEHPEVHMRATK